MIELKTLKDLEKNIIFTPTRVGIASIEFEKAKSDHPNPLVLAVELKKEAIKLVKWLLKITKTKIIKMPAIKLTKKGIDVRHGHFDGQCMMANHQPTSEFFSALILCKMYNLTEEDLK